MADYTVRIVAETDDADKKVKRLDERLKSVSNDKKIHIQLPGIQETIDNIKALGNALSTTYKIARQVPVIGPKIQDVEDLGDIALNSAKKVVQAGKLVASATPGNILSGATSGSVNAVNQLAKNTAELGYTVFGVTQSVNVLKAAFGSFFEDTIGREIQLQEALLRTKTTLVSTTDIAVNGKRITDPYEAILKLEGPINNTIDSIRQRSLEIAGTTSDAIIQVFGVVASQIGNIGGNLKDAEDLAITFSAALGTLGLSDPFYATQEIRSILTGTIDQNSILARSLGLTNEEVTKAKTSADGLVNFLQKRLAAFTAGQSLAAKGFAGITSNIQEFNEEIKRAFGRGFLAPLLEGLTLLYTRLQVVFKPAFGIADALGKAGGSIARGFVGAAAAAPSLQGMSQRNMLQSTEGGQKYAISAFLQIQTAVDKLRPQIASLIDQIVKGLAQLAGGLVKLTEGFANFKFEQFKIYLSALTGLGAVLNATVIPAFTALMNVYGEILKNPIGQWFTQLSTTMSVLEKVGVLPLVRTVYTLSAIIPSVLKTFKALGQAFDWVKVKLAGLVDFIITGFSMAVSAASEAVVALGRTLLNVVQLGINKLLLGLQSAAGQLGVFLVELGTTIQQLYPRFGQLAVGVSSVGKAIIGLIPALERARLGYAEFALSAIESLTKLQVKTEQVKQGVATFGERIKGAIGGAAGKIVGSLKDMVWGLIVFQAQMLALQIITGAVTKIVSDWQRKQQEISDQTRAELAVKRLSTIYAEVGENATAATEAAKEFEQAIVNTRIDSLTKQIGELSEKMQEVSDLGKSKGIGNFFRAVAFSLNPSNLFDKRQMKALSEGPKGTTIFDAFLTVKREELNKIRTELERLTKFQDRQKQNEKATEDVQVLAKERNQLEKEIKDLRKQYAREISDFEWSERQKLLQLEQQAKQAEQEKARTAMERRFREENQQLGEIGAGFKQIFDNYDRAIFDAQVESQRKQSELALRRQEVEKQIADYRYKLEEQTTKLRERVGDYERKLEDYKTQEARRRSQEVLRNAAEEASIRNGTNKLLLTPDDKTRFLNAAAQQGISAERGLALVLSGGSQGADWQGLNPEGVVKAIKEKFGQIIGLPQAQFLKILGLRANALTGQSLAGSYLLGQAEATLGTGAFKRTSPASPPSINPITSLRKEQDSYIQRYRAALEETLKQQAIAIKTAFIDKTEEALKAFKEQMMNPATWGIPNIGSMKEGISTNADRIKQLQQGASSGSTYDILGSGMSALARRAQGAGSTLNDVFSKNNVRFDEALAETLNTGAIPKYLLEILDKSLPSIAERVKTVFNGAIKAVRTLKSEVAPLTIISDMQEQTASLAQMTLDLKNNAEAVKYRNRLLAEGFSSERIDAEMQIYAIQKRSNELYANANKILTDRRDRISEIQKLLKDPQTTGTERTALQAELTKAQDRVKELEEQLNQAQAQQTKTITDIRNNADQRQDPVLELLSRWRTEIEDTRSMIASLAQTIQTEFAGAMSTALTGVIDGTTTIQEAFANMFRNIGKAFLDMAIRMIAQALIMRVLGIFLPGAGAAAGSAGEALSQFNRGVAQYSMATGGIASGPHTGYAATLHGTEAVVPLPNGRSIPVEFDGAGNSGVSVGAINITVENTGDKLSPQAQKQIANQVQGLVLSTLVNQKRSGGIL